MRTHWVEFIIEGQPQYQCRVDPHIVGSHVFAWQADGSINLLALQAVTCVNCLRSLCRREREQKRTAVADKITAIIYNMAAV